MRYCRKLSVHAGRTVPHGDLLKSVWGRQNPDDNRTVHAAVKNIRRKLGDSAKSPTYIFNESGVGYRLGAALNRAVTGTRRSRFR